MEGDSMELVANYMDDISIHTLRMEGDAFLHVISVFDGNHFNPHPPHGG